jgi:hypothetical protein
LSLPQLLNAAWINLYPGFWKDLFISFARQDLAACFCRVRATFGQYLLFNQSGEESMANGFKEGGDSRHAEKQQPHPSESARSQEQGALSRFHEEIHDSRSTRGAEGSQAAAPGSRAPELSGSSLHDYLNKGSAAAKSMLNGFEIVGDYASSAKQSVKDGASSAFHAVGAGLSSVGATVKDGAASVVQKSGDGLGSAAKFAADSASYAGTKLGNVADMGLAVGQGAVEAGKELATGAVEWVKDHPKTSAAIAVGGLAAVELASFGSATPAVATALGYLGTAATVGGIGSAAALTGRAAYDVSQHGDVKKLWNQESLPPEEVARAREGFIRDTRDAALADATLAFGPAAKAAGKLFKGGQAALDAGKAGKTAEAAVPAPLSQTPGQLEIPPAFRPDHSRPEIIGSLGVGALAAQRLEATESGAAILKTVRELGETAHKTHDLLHDRNHDH